MQRKVSVCLLIIMVFTMFVSGCQRVGIHSDKDITSEHTVQNTEKDAGKNVSRIILSSDVMQLENGLSAIKYEGSCGFDEFLQQGGASSDAEVVSYISQKLLSYAGGLSLEKMSFGCSTVSVQDKNGNALFGRNFDWNTCSAMIVQNIPQNGYASISTVNTDFISMSGMKISSLPAKAQAVVCLYAPLDGMNEKGLAVSVNMIQDSAGISQNSDKPDITTTTAIRLLLDKAADVEEALELLKKYDMHASLGYMMHLALADTKGRSVVVEYVNNEMIVNDTQVVTNFYFAEGEKKGTGTAQSHERYDILTKALESHKTMNMEDVKDALGSVSKKNFGEFESTEWSVVFNQSTGEVHYYHRENYDNRYIFNIK